MGPEDIPRFFRRASLILGLVNVYQPVARGFLLQEADVEDEDEFSELLGFLTSRGLIRKLPGNEFRTTWLGQQSLSSGLTGQRRDVQRMWFLSDRSDERRRERRTVEGEALQ